MTDEDKMIRRKYEATHQPQPEKQQPKQASGGSAPLGAPADCCRQSVQPSVVRCSASPPHEHEYHQEFERIENDEWLEICKICNKTKDEIENVCPTCHRELGNQPSGGVAPPLSRGEHPQPSAEGWTEEQKELLARLAFNNSQWRLHPELEYSREASIQKFKQMKEQGSIIDKGCLETYANYIQQVELCLIEMNKLSPPAQAQPCQSEELTEMLARTVWDMNNVPAWRSMAEGAEEKIIMRMKMRPIIHKLLATHHQPRPTGKDGEKE